jgi:hypothetical protein
VDSYEAAAVRFSHRFECFGHINAPPCRNYADFCAEGGVVVGKAALRAATEAAAAPAEPGAAVEGEGAGEGADAPGAAGAATPEAEAAAANAGERRRQFAQAMAQAAFAAQAGPIAKGSRAFLSAAFESFSVAREVADRVEQHFLEAADDGLGDAPSKAQADMAALKAVATANCENVKRFINSTFFGDGAAGGGSARPELKLDYSLSELFPVVSVPDPPPASSSS